MNILHTPSASPQRSTSKRCTSSHISYIISLYNVKVQHNVYSRQEIKH